MRPLFIKHLSVWGTVWKWTKRKKGKIWSLKNVDGKEVLAPKDITDPSMQITKTTKRNARMPNWAFYKKRFRRFDLQFQGTFKAWNRVYLHKLAYDIYFQMFILILEFSHLWISIISDIWIIKLITIHNGRSGRGNHQQDQRIRQGSHHCQL